MKNLHGLLTRFTGRVGLVFVLVFGSLNSAVAAENQCSFTDGYALAEAKRLLNMSVLDQPPFLYQKYFLVQLSYKPTFCESLNEVNRQILNLNETEIGEFASVALQTYQSVESAENTKALNSLGARLDTFMTALSSVNIASIDKMVPGYQTVTEKCAAYGQSGAEAVYLNIKERDIAIEGIDAAVRSYQKIYDEQAYVRVRIKDMFIKGYEKAFSVCMAGR